MKGRNKNLNPWIANMVSREQAEVAVSRVAHSLKAMTYIELKNLCDEISANPERAVWHEPVNGGTVELGLMISESRSIRNHICVELKAWDFVKNRCRIVPGVYFERYKSGKLYVAPNLTWSRFFIATLVIIGAIGLLSVLAIYYGGA